jgi:hypothetical protein
MLLWVVLALTFSDNWHFSETYGRFERERRAGIQCLIKHQRIRSESRSTRCPILYPAPIEDHVARAIQLEVSFTRKLSKLRPPTQNLR